jgi:hypothetical protein
MIFCNITFAENFLFMSEKKFNYKEQYGVIAICKDEKEQKRVYEMLQKLGLILKVVVV